MKEDVWTTIIEELDLDLSKDLNLVSAADIKHVTDEEPRLVAYMDNREALPEILRRNGIFLISVKNGVYALVKGEGFHDLEPNLDLTVFKSNIEFPLKTLQSGSGEDRYLMYALHSGMISNFTGVTSWYPTNRGRMRSGSFNFVVGDSPLIDVDGVQFQVDLLLESAEEILIIEGKTSSHSSFMTRQLYYPFRFWSTQVPSKKIRTAFFVFNQETGIYHIWEYGFVDERDYSSIELKRAASYILETPQRTLEEFLDVEVQHIDTIPTLFRIPQANDIFKVLEFPICVAEGINNYEAIAVHFGFTTRQSSYYRDAAEGLGLVAITEDNNYVLTALGQIYVALSGQARNTLFARRIMMHPIFNRILEDLRSSSINVATIDYISSVIRNNSELSGTTPPRRASTILSWFRWLESTLGIVRVTSEGISLPRE